PFVYQASPDSKPWEVSTYDHSYLGSVSIHRALLSSDHTAFAQLTLDLGAAKGGAMAHLLGVGSNLKSRDGAYVPSLGLGSASVSPLDMASAYATIAAGGVYSEPMAIRKGVLPAGEVDRGAGWGRGKKKRAFFAGG